MMVDGQVIFQDFGVQNMRQAKELKVHFNLYQMYQVGEIKQLEHNMQQQFKQHMDIQYQMQIQME